MRTGTVVIGAGQAGLALSHHLRTAGHAHVLLERGRVGERWRSQRWDSLRLLTPNWLNRLPGAPELADPDGFLDRDGFVAHLEAYAADAPVMERTTVTGVERAGHGFRVTTQDAELHGRAVVIATGDCDTARVPVIAAGAPAWLHQRHTSAYRNPAGLPDGGVLVVGAGPSGQQVAAELRRAGRRVYLAVGRHARMPRRYRGRDAFAWLHATGQLGVHAGEVRDLAAARRAPSFPLSGSGETLGLDALASLGVTLTGRLRGFAGAHALFVDDLQASARDADRRLWRQLAAIDLHIARTHTPAPDPDAPAPLELVGGPAAVNLKAAGVNTILWATGYRRAYPWLRLPVLDANGDLVHDEGRTPVPGLYALGLRFQRTRRSHLIGGVGDDAAFIAAAILGRRERRAA